MHLATLTPLHLSTLTASLSPAASPGTTVPQISESDDAEIFAESSLDAYVRNALSHGASSGRTAPQLVESIESSNNPSHIRSTSNQSSEPCQVAQYPQQKLLESIHPSNNAPHIPESDDPGQTAAQIPDSTLDAYVRNARADSLYRERGGGGGGGREGGGRSHEPTACANIASNHTRVLVVTESGAVGSNHSRPRIVNAEPRGAIASASLVSFRGKIVTEVCAPKARVTAAVGCRVVSRRPAVRAHRLPIASGHSRIAKIRQQSWASTVCHLAQKAFFLASPVPRILWRELSVTRAHSHVNLAASCC